MDNRTPHSREFAFQSLFRGVKANKHLSGDVLGLSYGVGVTVRYIFKSISAFTGPILTSEVLFES